MIVKIDITTIQVITSIFFIVVSLIFYFICRGGIKRSWKNLEKSPIDITKYHSIAQKVAELKTIEFLFDCLLFVIPALISFAIGKPFVLASEFFSKLLNALMPLNDGIDFHLILYVTLTCSLISGRLVWKYFNIQNENHTSFESVAVKWEGNTSDNSNNTNSIA
jgi:uncharacterized membrane protein